MRWILGLYFAAFFLLTFAVLLTHSPIRKFFGRQVERYISFTKPEEKESLSLRQVLSWFINLISPLLTKKSFAAKLQLQLEHGGIPLRASEFIFFHSIGFIAAVVIGYIIAGPVGLILLSLIAGILPVLALKRSIGQRENKFHEQLPDTLSLISGALKAGYSFLQAVDMTVKETSPPMSVEFKRVLTEARLGLPLEQALDNMAKRVASDSFDWTVMAVKIQREVGGNLAEILEILADTVRERDRVSRQVKVLTAEGRLSALILFLLPFGVGLLLMIANPDYLSLLVKNTLGFAMMGAAALLLVVGGFWLKKVVSIEV